MLGVFFRWCVITGYTRKDPTLGVPVPRVPRAVPRRVHRDACTAIFAACTNPREELMVALCLNEGLRVGEVARVELGDIDWHAKTMTVHGKGGHERLVPITAATWRKIVAHSDGRGRAGPLLRSQQPGREYLPISPRRVSVLVSAVMRRAGVAETGHGLRHTAAAETLESGATIRQVQVMLGHASVQTTTRYLGPVDAEGLRRYMDARGVDTT
jgi:site-specific recombinase XerD